MGYLERSANLEAERARKTRIVQSRNKKREITKKEKVAT